MRINFFVLKLSRSSSHDGSEQSAEIETKMANEEVTADVQANQVDDELEEEPVVEDNEVVDEPDEELVEDEVEEEDEVSEEDE